MWACLAVFIHFLWKFSLWLLRKFAFAALSFLLSLKGDAVVCAYSIRFAIKMTTPLHLCTCFLFLERKIPPSFTKKPSETLEDTAGKLVKIEARVAGSQPMTITWSKDDTEIFSSDSYDMTFKNNTAVLLIKNSRLSDSGTYTCSANNEAGSASCKVSVHITGTSLWCMAIVCMR